MAPIHCPICLSGADKGRSRDYGERQQYACRQCGTFEICASAIAVLKTRFDENPELRQRLSYQIRRAVDAGSHPLVNTANLEDMIRAPLPTRQGQVLLLLQLIQQRLGEDYYGWAEFPRPELHAAIAVVGVGTYESLRNLINTVQKEGLIAQDERADNTLVLSLTGDGWDRLESASVSEPKVGQGSAETIPQRVSDVQAQLLPDNVQREMHPRIAHAAMQLYHDGHYANAVLDAVKELVQLVRARSGKSNLDGVPLMQNVFSPKNPILTFNDLQDQSDQDEQTGLMGLFVGAVMGLRNPRAHKRVKDDPERALEFIAFVSLLAKLLDGAKKSPRGS